VQIDIYALYAGRVLNNIFGELNNDISQRIYSVLGRSIGLRRNIDEPG
jgi:hypothetical protein